MSSLRLLFQLGLCARRAASESSREKTWSRFHATAVSTPLLSGAWLTQPTRDLETIAEGIEVPTEGELFDDWREVTQYCRKKFCRLFFTDKGWYKIAKMTTHCLYHCVGYKIVVIINRKIGDFKFREFGEFICTRKLKRSRPRSNSKKFFISIFVFAKKEDIKVSILLIKINK